MNKGYTVTLSLRYTKDVEIETEEEDEEKIKREAKDAFNIDVWDRGGLDDIIDGVQVVKIERNYSEKPESLLTPKEKLKDYVVWFFSRSSEIYVTVSAISKTGAEEKAEDEITLELTSDDGETEVNVNKWSWEGTELAEWEKDD